MNLFNYFIIFILKLIYIQDVSQNVISSGHFVVSRYVKILWKRDEFAKYQKKHSISAEPKKHLKNNNLNLLKYNCHLHKCMVNAILNILSMKVRDTLLMFFWFRWQKHICHNICRVKKLIRLIYGKLENFVKKE